MIHSEPVSCRIYNNSYNVTQPVSSNAVNFFVHISGTSILRIENTIFESSEAFAFIISSAMPLSFRGSGKVCIFSSSRSFLNEIDNLSIGKTIISLLPQSHHPLYYGFLLDQNISSRIDQILAGLYREINLKRSDYLDMVHINFCELLIILKRIGALSEGELKAWSGKQRIWGIDDIIHFITENFDSSFSLDDLASRCALNSSYFSRAFKEQTGIPLFKYINRLRIDRACQLLKASSMTIIDIAFSVGYNNVSFFNRYFKKLMSISPGEYRRRVKG